MTVAAPFWWLLFLPLAAYLVWMSLSSYAQLVPAAKWAAFLLRSSVLLLLVAALSQPTLSVRSSLQHIVFLVDVSRSVSPENLDAALHDVESLVRAAREQSLPSQFSVVAFGQVPRLLVAPTETWPGVEEDVREQILYQRTLPALHAKRAGLMGAGRTDGDPVLEEAVQRIVRVTRFRDEVAGDHTDMEAALRLGLSIGSPNISRTIYVFTDGNFSRGRWQDACSAAARGRVLVHCVSLDRPQPPEVSVTEVAVPQKTRIHEGFSPRGGQDPCPAGYPSGKQYWLFACCGSRSRARPVR